MAIRKLVAPTNNARAVYNNIPKRPGVITTQSYLRLEQQLGTTSQVTFEVLTNQGQATKNERRLNLTDAFTITSMAIMIYKQASGANISASTLDTFPNPLTYVGAGEAAALMGIYNGYLSVRVDSTVYIDSLDCFRFYRVGVAQKGLAITVTPTSYQANEYSAGDYPFYALTPTIRIAGSTNNQITINLPESVAMAGTAGSTNYVVCYLRGFLEQAGARFTSK